MAQAELPHRRRSQRARKPSCKKREADKSEALEEQRIQARRRPKNRRRRSTETVTVPQGEDTQISPREGLPSPETLGAALGPMAPSHGVVAERQLSPETLGAVLALVAIHRDAFADKGVTHAPSSGHPPGAGNLNAQAQSPKTKLPTSTARTRQRRSDPANIPQHSPSPSPGSPCRDLECDGCRFL